VSDAVDIAAPQHPRGDGAVAKRRRAARRRGRGITPYLLLAPAGLWLLLFFALPLLQTINVSLSAGSLVEGLQGPPAVWHWDNYAAIANYLPNLRNSLVFGGLATVLAFLLGYPVAYTIAFHGGRYRGVLLFLVIAPFLTSYIVRIISWQRLLSSDGPLLNALADLGLVSERFSIVGTPTAVVAGLTYQLVPFVVLPLYTALDRVDVRLVEAAQDLYAGRWRRGARVGAAFGAVLGLALAFALSPSAPPADRALVFALVLGLVGAVVASRWISEAFVRVVWPLSRPGVFAATLFAFIPALGDYVNAALLGNVNTQMLGNVIQQQFLVAADYPIAGALACLLLALLLIGAVLYLRAVGTRGALDHV
jgi:spermidine/putrescine transport system permease protein